MGIKTTTLAQDEAMMRLAIEQAHLAEAQGEVPIGAVVSLQGEVIGKGHNQVISQSDPSAHAEVKALQSAGQHLNNYRFPDATLYVTLEPCMMCAGALVHARVARVVFGAYDGKTGVITTVDALWDRPYHNHQIDWQGGVLETTCAQLISDFFKRRRAAQKAAKKQP